VRPARTHVRQLMLANAKDAATALARLASG
jgi:hypothetical protein